MSQKPTIHGAPPTRRAPRFLPALALACAMAAPLHADGAPAAAAGGTETARVSLREGRPTALADAVKALKARPLGAAENLLAALALFNASQFDDAARHLRRALAAAPDLFKDEPALATNMPAGAIALRLGELAPLAEKDAELCFLAGSVCVLAGDIPRALPLLVRAEELAGTDAQSAAVTARATGTPHLDRARERATAALRLGRFDEAARSFAFAALDCPTCAEHYAGAAMALALAGDGTMARRLMDLALSRANHARLTSWLRDLRLPPGRAVQATAAAREPAVRSATLAELRLAGCVALAAGMFNTAREALVAALVLDKLDVLSVEILRFMDAERLVGDPPGANETPPAEMPKPQESPPDGTAPAGGQPVELARQHIRRLEFGQALKVLDPLARADQPDNMVLFLVFVASVGHSQPQQGSDALQAWFARADNAARTRLNAVRELFDRAEHFTQWRKLILDLRQADPDASLPRLLSAYVELSNGAYAAARAEVEVALISAGGNEMLKSLQRILQGEAFREDSAAPRIDDKPAAKVLIGRADALFRKGEYEGARTELLAALEASPAEPGLDGALLRVYFALGDYARGARQAEALLADQEIASRAAADFKYYIEAGYDSKDEFNKHLEALGKAAGAKVSAADEYLLLGVIQFSRSQWREAAAALNEWQGLNLNKAQNVAVLKLLEHARKNA